MHVQMGEARDPSLACLRIVAISTPMVMAKTTHGTWGCACPFIPYQNLAKEAFMSKAFIYPMAAAALLVGAGMASAQTTTPQSTTGTPAASTAATTDAAKVTLTEAQAKSWVDKPVYSSDNKQIGEVVAFKRGADNVVTEMHADIGGMMGMGETRVKLTPAQFKLQGDRVTLSLTQEQAKNLPKAAS
jgi:hypothetical protein